jgi:hypothetical protein
MPVARPLLAWIGVGCPGRASPEAVEAARLDSARAARGVTPSPARPALGFALDVSTRTDVDAWAAERKLTCKESQRGTVLRCSAVPAAELGHGGSDVDDLSFLFEPATMRLVTVTALRNQLDAPSAAAAMNGVADALARSLGEGKRRGEATAPYLSAGPLRTAVVEYRFSDYIASVSATNLGGRVAVREHYMSAVD